MNLALLSECHATSGSGYTVGRRLARNTLLNIAGEATPLVLGLITIPILVRALGNDRYGVLTMSYIVIGYLGLFDLGFGRAATQQISDAIGAGAGKDIPAIFWTSMITMLVLGIVAAALVAGTSHWFVNSVLRMPAALRSESASALIILGIAMPLVLSGSCLTGTLASLQRFDLTSIIGAATGIFSFAAPLGVLLFTRNLSWIVLVLVLGRLGAWIASLVLCLRLVPSLAADIRPSIKSLVPLLSFGGWITVSGLASPLMVNLDRLIIGSMLSSAAVTYYSVPFQIVNKLPMLPGAMSNVLFPAFSATARLHPARASKLFERASRYSLLVLFPGVLILFCFAQEVLALFFGTDIASHGYCAMRWLLIGVLANGLALIPYGLVQAANRPDLTAKFHVAEFPIYFTALFVLLPRFGIAGVAAAWTIRVTADSLALFAAAATILPGTRTTILYVIALTTGASGFIGCAAMMRAADHRTLFALAALISYVAVGWQWVLETNDRLLVRNAIIRLRMRLMQYLSVAI